METPKVSDVPGGFLFEWPEAKVAIRVSRLRQHSSDGHVSGEIAIFSLPELRSLYPPTSLNFLADQTRTRLAKTLAEEDSERDWATIIKQVCREAPERFRAGEPVRELWTSEDIAPPEWALKPILYKELPTIIYGEKEVCKSTLALAAYTCLTLPWDDNPLGWTAPSKTVKTLLLDYEVGYKVAQYNLKRLVEGMGLPPIPLYYRRGLLPLADDIEQIAERMAEIKAEAIIIDSLAPAVGGDSYAPEAANRFSLALRQLNCAALVIGQTSKQNDKKKSVLGSTLFEYFARHIFELKKVQEEGENSLDIALYNTYHNLGAHIPAQGFRLSFNGVGVKIETCAITAPELVARLGAQIQILKALARGPLMPKDIAEKTGLLPNTVSVTLTRLKNQGKVLHLDTGWGLPE